MHVIKQHQANWIGHVLRHDCLLKTVLEGKMEGKQTRGKPSRKMLDLLMEQEDKKISYQELKRRAEDRIQWHHHHLNLPYGRAHKREALFARGTFFIQCYLIVHSCGHSPIHNLGTQVFAIVPYLANTTYDKHCTRLFYCCYVQWHRGLKKLGQEVAVF